MEAARNFLYDLITTALNGVFNVIVNANDIITQRPESFNSTAFNMAKSISNAIVPISIIIAVIFFVMEFCKKTMLFEVTTPENIAKLVFKFIFCKVFIQASFEFCATIYDGIFGILSNVVGITSGNDQLLSLQASIAVDAIKTQIDAMGLFEMIAMLPFLAIFALVLIVINWIITIIIYGRFIELYILFALCSIPLATLTSDSTHDIAKRFLQKFVAICLQAVVMVVILAVFSAVIYGTAIDATGSMLDIMGQYILMFLILVLTMFKSGSWAKEIVGLG